MATDIIARALAIKANKTLPAISSADAGKLATVDSNGKWAAANLTVGQGEVAVDNTLLVSGAAADAKVTGDKITDLKSALKVNPVLLKALTGFTGIDTINGYVQPDGTFRDNVGSDWVRTDYIETVSGAHIVSSLKGYDAFPIIAFYDESKAYMQSASVISSTQSVVNTDIVVPQGVKYAIFVSQTNYEGREFSIEVPQTIGETVSTIIDEVDEIKTELATDYYKNITGFNGQTTYDGYVKDDGTFNDGGTGWVRTGYIETGEGATLISSLKGYLTLPLVAFYDESKTYLQSISVLSDTQSIINTNMKVPAGVKYAVFVSQTNYANRVFTVGTPANTSEALNVIGDDLYLYENLNIACLGDSLTKGLDGNNQVLLTNYPYYMQQTRLKKCNINNLGVSVSTTKTYWNNNKSDINVDQTTDVILCMWGTNGDLMSNTLATDVEPYDDYEDYANTGVGCYCKIIEYLMELTQNNAQIVLLTPPYNGNNSINDRVYAAQSVVKAIAERYNLPVIDMFKCGIGKYNYQTYMPIDSVHFSADGYEYIGKYIGSCIKSVCAK